MGKIFKKVFKDPLYDYIRIDNNVCEKIIDDKYFQRLRRIEQTSMRCLYPSARHDRFIHSIGVYHLAKVAIKALKRNKYVVINDEKNCAEGSSVPVCKVCGASVKPDVVLYGEALNDIVIREAVSDISSADCLIIGGTSLVVYPAAGFINYFNGDNMILINKTATAYDGKANLVIYDSIGKILGD